MIKFTKGNYKGVFYKGWQDPILLSKIWVVIAPETLKDCGEFFKKITGAPNPVMDDAIAQCSSTWDPKLKPKHQVFLFFKSDVQLSTLVHECVHAKNHIWAHRGVRPDCDNDEMEAYYMDYMVNHVKDILDEYWDLKDNKKNDRRGKRKKPIKKKAL